MNKAAWAGAGEAERAARISIRPHPLSLSGGNVDAEIRDGVASVQIPPLAQNGEDGTSLAQAASTAASAVVTLGGDDLVSQECTENADAGIVPLDYDYGDGVIAPPQHCNCRCTLLPEILEEVQDEEGESAKLEKHNDNHDEQGRFASSPFTPVHEAKDWEEAVLVLSQAKCGMVRGALEHPDIGKIDVVWGEYNHITGKGFGLVKIIAIHGNVVSRLSSIIKNMSEKSGKGRDILNSKDFRAVICNDWKGNPTNPWLSTAYKKD